MDRWVLMKLGLLLFAGLLVIYTRFLWPQIFGRMHIEGITFIAAIMDVSLHMMAFLAFVAGGLQRVFWFTQRIAQVDNAHTINSA